MYVAYKLAQLALQPEIWILSCLVVALALSWRMQQQRLLRWLLLVTVTMFWGLGTRPLNHLLILPLKIPILSIEEMRAQRTDAVIVLTGAMPRLICGITLLREGVATRLIIVGGAGNPLQQQLPESEAMRELALRLGAPPKAIMTETSSRTTWESAVALRQQFPHISKVVLVTSAIHLPRATAVFHKQGFTVTPTSCAESKSSKDWDIADFVPSGTRLATSQEVIRELAGFAAYRILGWL